MPKLRSPHDDTSEWATRAVEALAKDTPFVTRDILPRIHATDVKMLENDDPEMRARGFGLAQGVLPLLDERQHAELVRSMMRAYCWPVVGNRLVANKRRDKTYANGDAQARLLGILAFSVAAERIKDESLANQVALELLSAIGTEQTPDFFPGHWELYGIAKLAPHVSGPLRERILLTLIASVANDKYVYSLTSGEPSPPLHAGGEALSIVAPLLSRDLLDQAEKAIPINKKGRFPYLFIPDDSPLGFSVVARSWPTAEAYESMYGSARKALAVRRRELANAVPILNPGGK